NNERLWMPIRRDMVRPPGAVAGPGDRLGERKRFRRVGGSIAPAAELGPERGEPPRRLAARVAEGRLEPQHYILQRLATFRGRQVSAQNEERGARRVRIDRARHVRRLADV